MNGRTFAMNGRTLAMKVTAGITFLLLVLLTSAPASAHHAFAAEFDATKCTDITGVLTKVAYENPHSYVWVDVKNAAGKVESNTFQLSSPSSGSNSSHRNSSRTRNSLRRAAA